MTSCSARIPRVASFLFQCLGLCYCTISDLIFTLAPRINVMSFSHFHPAPLSLDSFHGPFTHPSFPRLFVSWDIHTTTFWLYALGRPTLVYSFRHVSPVCLGSGDDIPEADIDLNEPHTSTYVTQLESVHLIRSCVHAVCKGRGDIDDSGLPNKENEKPNRTDVKKT